MICENLGAVFLFAQ